MCRTGGRRCPSHLNPGSVKSRNARRRDLYASNKTSESFTANQSLSSSIQEAYFKTTIVRNDGSELLPLYHGSAQEFDEFNPSTLGKGNDSWGNGFYFTDQQNVANGYAAESKSATANVKEFYLNLTNPIYVDGKENMSLNSVTFPLATITKILKEHPDAYLQPNNETGDMSFLGDYSEKYWDKPEHTKAEIEAIIEEVAKEHFSTSSWVELENVYGRDHGSAFLQSVHKNTGHDGVIVDFKEDGKHYVAWFANQMKLTSNLNPKEDNVF